MTDHNPKENNYLKKSAKIFKVNGTLFIFTIITSVLIRPIIENHYIKDLIIGLPLLIIFLLSPFGLYFSIKSYLKREGSKIIRFKYLFSNSFFFLLLLVFLIALIRDVLNFFQ